MIPESMEAVCLMGYGGLDQLEFRKNTPVPLPGPGEVLIKVGAAGVNNTDINTRTGWYNKNVSSGTTQSGGSQGFGVDIDGMGDWAIDITFPRIQGADCAGRIVEVGEGVDSARVGERVICQPYVYDENDPDWLEKAGFLGADRDGAFAQYTKIPAGNAFKVSESLPFSDAELATLPCSGGTAMNMLLMAGINKGDTVLVTGASGGVGTFLVQIAKYYGAEVVAVCSPGKADAVKALGADATVDRSSPDLGKDIHQVLKGKPLTLIADVVGGEQFGPCLSMLKRGGRYVTAGAIAGPLVQLDLRSLYLKNLRFFGSTVYWPATFPKLMEILEDQGIKPAVSATYPLSSLKEAQEAFLEKRHVGSLVLLPNDTVVP